MATLTDPRANVEQSTKSARSAATSRIAKNHERFSANMDKAEVLLEAGRIDEALLQAHLAANIATHEHCGIFGSARLERLIHTIAIAIPYQNERVQNRKTRAKDIRKVLHVCTEAVPVGGLTRMISRWMDADPSRSNSFVVTRQRRAIPSHLRQAVARSGGQIYRLNTQVGSQIDWIKRLREIARDYDLILLHINCEDLIPLVAFAQANDFPPVLMLNHADHLFWAGPSVSHAVLNLREAAHDITVNRRGVAPERSLYLPTLVDARRRRTREEARAALDIPQDTQLIISVARGSKYRTIDGISYADRFVDVVKANPRARVMVIGAGMPSDWARANAETDGRIVGVAEQPDVALYFEAADIYVDSYPFSSSTSMMEASCYGLPLLTLFTLPDEARLFGINHLGLIGGVIQARTTSDWEAQLTNLIRDKEWRDERSMEAIKAVACTQPEEWHVWLEAAYERVLELQPLPSPPPSPAIDIDSAKCGEPDWRHQDIYGAAIGEVELTKDYAGTMSFAARLRVCNALMRAGTISIAELARLLPPEWLKRRLKS